MKRLVLIFVFVFCCSLMFLSFSYAEQQSTASLLEEKKLEREKKEEEMRIKAEIFKAEREEFKRKEIEKREAEEKRITSEWEKTGFNSVEIGKWKGKGFLPSTAKRLRFQCPKGAGDIRDLFFDNPYDLVGKCLNIQASRLQLLSRTVGLYIPVVGENPLLIDFTPDSAPALFGFRSGQPGDKGYILKGTGVYKYRTVRGDLLIIPKFRVID